MEFLRHTWQRLRRRDSAAECIARFLSLPEHRWILESRALRQGISELLAEISPQDLAKILEQRRLLLLFCNQEMSAGFHQYQGREVVLVFPELKRRLLSAQRREGQAVLAHELGHVVRDHSQKRIGALAAQLEADRFAWETGFGEELMSVLLEYEVTEELYERLKTLQALNRQRRR